MVVAGGEVRSNAKERCVVLPSGGIFFSVARPLTVFLWLILRPALSLRVNFGSDETFCTYIFVYMYIWMCVYRDVYFVVCLMRADDRGVVTP